MTILFRGLRTAGKGWVEGDLAHGFGKKECFIMPKCEFATRNLGYDENDPEEVKMMLDNDEFALGGFIPVLQETIGQFSGLLDKNGKRIFEGDVFSNGFYVMWHDDRCKWISTSGKSFSSIDCDDLDVDYILDHEIEVIGNIHEK